ncbi:siderophore-interacting protein [Plantibacter flavus]|uniref:siderophore-interacting protein n=1 Tax=Plantibacter flavus TaxID=150123 RepID=UPI003F17D386
MTVEDTTDADADADAPRHTATLRSRTELSPHLIRLTFGSVSPAFTSTGHADEFVSLHIPAPTTDESPVVRYYSIRAWRDEAGELDIDFVLHGHGPASNWAATAQPGAIVCFDLPRGHFAPRSDAQWIGLVGDATALPAVARVLEEREAGAPPAHVVLLVESDSDRLRLPLQPGDTVEWLRPGDDLVAAARTVAARDEPGYLWFSGEAADMRAVRRHVRRELGRPPTQWTTMAYWRRDSASWRERFDSRGAAFRERFEGIYASADDPEVQRDRAEELLERNGL